ncbi:hypothetical protein HZB07_02100 [Candidatus Saganbacteria bacterium]|nr:hypothetical protein [Candidatus Saganbacteria bacterium]
MRKILQLIIIIFVGWILWVAGFPFPYFINNYRLNSFADQLIKIPLPPETKRAGKFIKQFGNLGPCSKHGDYYAEFKIVSSLTFNQLKKFYSQYSIEVPEIDNMFTSQFRGLGTHDPNFIDVEKISGQSGKYIVSVFDGDYWPNDFRCW